MGSGAMLLGWYYQLCYLLNMTFPSFLWLTGFLIYEMRVTTIITAPAFYICCRTLVHLKYRLAPHNKDSINIVYHCLKLSILYLTCSHPICSVKLFCMIMATLTSFSGLHFWFPDMPLSVIQGFLLALLK